MKILIPMAGAGQRFMDAGYKVHKPAILTYDRRTGKKIPMVVCAVLDLPGVEPDGSNVIFIDRLFHKEEGVEEEIRKYFPKAQFVTVEKLTEGQACTCMLARELLNPGESVLIAGCDNGMLMDEKKFRTLTEECDEIVFTYRNNEAVLKNPDAYGWMKVDDQDNIIGTSIKKAISGEPMKDHAVVATFWFKTAELFIKATEKMIAEDDRINQEFYVDQVVKHVLDLGCLAKVFEIDRYIGWGTPKDYEEYQKTYEYWKGFLQEEKLL
ncbi:MAG: nucleotidyltransferase [Clostridiales bacterium]|nr:nucleotidyltransferase [Clostridiales bacterium]